MQGWKACSPFQDTRYKDRDKVGGSQTIVYYQARYVVVTSAEPSIASAHGFVHTTDKPSMVPALTSSLLGLTIGGHTEDSELGVGGHQDGKMPQFMQKTDVWLEALTKELGEVDLLQ